MAEPKTLYIRRQEDLEEISRVARDQQCLAFDTEFINDRTYQPRLCLIQVGLSDRLSIVDPLSNLDLSPFYDLFHDPDVVKIVHAGQQDMEIVYRATRRTPSNIFDSQVVGALAGHGDQIGYARLVQRLCGVRISKGETLSDWSRRPLSSEQIDYALDDVRYLHAIRDALLLDLRERGREEWARQECLRYEDPDRYEVDPDRDYRRVRGAWKLEPAELAILRELHRWREDEASQSDEPRGRISRDDGLIALVRRSPKHPRDLNGFRALHRSVVSRCGPDIVAAVARGREIPPEQRPEPISHPDLEPDAAVRIDFLWAFLRSRAASLGIGPRTLLPRDTLTRIVAEHDRGTSTSGDLPGLVGWRADLLAHDLRAILSGRKGLSLPSPGKGEEALELIDLDDSP